MLIEADNKRELWDYCEEGQYLLCLSDGFLIKDVLPEQLKELRLTLIAAYFKKNNKYHRTNGPAVIYYDGDVYWYKNGLRFHPSPPLDSI